MASTAWKFPGTVATATNLAGHTFATPDNVKLDDTLVANDTGSKFDLTPPGEVSPSDGPELITSNYNFAIPYDSYITGIETKIEGGTDGNRVGELAYLTQLGSPTIIGTEKVDEWTDMPTDTTLAVHIYGSSTDLWDLRLTPTIVNSTSFGWVFMVYDELAPLQALVDYMQMRIHYLPAGATMMGSSF